MAERLEGAVVAPVALVLATEVAIARLRGAAGGRKLIRTAVKRGLPAGARGMTGHPDNPKPPASKAGARTR